MHEASERRRELDAMYQEKVNAAVMLAKCVAGLAIVVLLVTVGAGNGRVEDRSAVRGAPPPSTAAVGVNAEAHRKQVFDQRRRQFEGKVEPRSVASEARDATN